MGDEVIRRRVIVRGRVQGVGYRAFVARRADDAGIAGSASNKADGSVECMLEGRREAVLALVEELRRGPALAAVSAIEVMDEAPRGESEPFRWG